MDDDGHYFWDILLGMRKYSDLAGAIFDLDETLLNNFPPGEKMGLHGQSRLLAAHEVGKRRGSPGLQNFTYEQCVESFNKSKIHSLYGVIWEMLVIAGEVSGQQTLDPEHPLVQEMVEVKERLHEDLLRTKGREVAGASAFVKALSENGLAGKLAIASNATRSEIDIFLETSGLNRFFPPDKIIARQQLTHPKPHPDAYNLAFETLGLPESARSKVAAFEDDPRGIMSAKAAGLYTCAITTVYKREDLAKLAVPPDLIAGRYAEFAERLGLPGKLEI